MTDGVFCLWLTPLADVIVEGESLGTIIQRALTASGTSSASGFSQKAASAMKTQTGSVVDGTELIGKLIETFGVQIFTLGAFLFQFS